MMPRSLSPPHTLKIVFLLTVVAFHLKLPIVIEDYQRD